VNDQLYQRVLDIGRYITETRCTVRTAAEVFGVSKSTVHKDVTERLQALNPGLFQEVQEVLSFNKSIRHLRGGDATRRKYQRA
jgi:putative DeoR family transcriptional regulator (stage III sporulation protein D)